MHIKKSPLLTALLLVSSFNASALLLEGGIGNQYPDAKDDYNSAVIGLFPSASGNVSSNDRNGTIATFNGSSVGQYGLITSFDSSREYTYELFESTDNSSLPPDGVGIDSFTYTYANEFGQTDTARLIIDVNPDPAFAAPDDDQPYDNVDVEFNNRSEFATSLNSGRNIKGHLYNSADKDWYSLASAGNEIITLEVCPKGTSCFGKKSWVLYVFDADRLNDLNKLPLAANKGELARYLFKRWIDDTGTTSDASGQPLIDGIIGSSNHMYLAYDQGYFEGALIGIVDPCFDTLNTVDIGVPPGPKNYLIAISSPLKGDSGDADSCGAGSVILEKPGRNVTSTIELELGTVTKVLKTTEEYISIFPNSDDQYAIKITGTGLNPLNSETAIEAAASFNPFDRSLLIPKVRVGESMYAAKLTQPLHQARSTDNGINFILTAIEELSVEDVVDVYRATYNPETNEVLIPRVTDTNTGIGYSVILQYHAATNENTQAWFDVLSIVEIQ
ncbi:hypothetical protein BMR03_06540 [Methylococcaceae bacterium HT2]|nr:hypothetical protein BMR03_06540 [Methylococcaceae bacterium HT2]